MKIGDRVRIINHDILDIYPNDKNSRQVFLKQSGNGLGYISGRAGSHDKSLWWYVKWDNGNTECYPELYLMPATGHYPMPDPDITLEEIETYQALVNGRG